jgi:regulator of replication initiation timing
MEATTRENFLHQVRDTTGLMKRIGELVEENRKLAEEASDLRVLARLATVISIIEGSNDRQHTELLEADRRYQELMQRHTELIERSAEMLDGKKQPNEN